ncbi:MAG: sigma-54-dependent transcriptional regulator, partial [Thermoanaerobaculia bacterium]
MSERARLLVVDDESSIVDFLSLLFEEEGYAVRTACSAAEARQALAGQSFDLILCDVMMPDGSGLDILKEAKSGGIDSQAGGPAVVMMTAYTSTKTAIEAMKSGAADYISKPFDVEELKIVVQKALEREQLADENIYLRRELEQKYTFNNIIGKSPRMQAIFSLIERIARTSSTVLIHGESGTGKELIARAIHFASPRANRRFLSLNCGALPENLLESELFGHERGAFTDARAPRTGLVHEAQGGTLCLDEVDSLSPRAQVVLLRLLQDRTYRPVGSSRQHRGDVRFIAITNARLSDRVAAGAFRADLYYRLSILTVDLPPLRERKNDVPLLAAHFLGLYTHRSAIPALSPAAEGALMAYDWPGNVRE